MNYCRIRNSIRKYNKKLVTDLGITAFYGTQICIILFTRICLWSISWVKWNQSIPYHPVPLKIHFNIILSATHSSTKWNLSFKISNQKFVHTSHSFLACCMPCPSHVLWFDDPNNIFWGIKAPYAIFFCCFVPRNSKYFPRQFGIKTAFVCVFLILWETKSDTHIKQPVKLHDVNV
jgi:hypothetical protein